MDQKFGMQLLDQILHHLSRHAAEKRGVANGLHQVGLALGFVAGMLGDDVSPFAQITAMRTEQLVKQYEDQATPHHGQQKGDEVVNLDSAVGDVGVGQGLHGGRHQFQRQCGYQCTSAKAAHGPHFGIRHRRGDADNGAKHHRTRRNRTQNGCPQNQCRAHVLHVYLLFGQ